MQTYQLKCFSEHVYNNNLTLLQRTFQGTIGSVVDRILSADLKIEDITVNKSTKDLVKGIFPKLKPLAAVQWLMRNSFSDGTPYYFYETASNGIIFESLKELADQEPFEEYRYTPYSAALINPETDEGYEDDRTTIKRFSSNYNVSKLMSSIEGAYGSTLHTIDISNKKYVKTVFDYDTHIKVKLNKHKPFSDKALFLNRKLTEHISAKNYFLSLNTGAFDKHSNYHQPGGDIDLLKSRSHLENLNYMQHEIVIPGDFNLEVGKLLKLRIAKPQEEQSKDNIDKIQSGIYLVTAIQHIFGEKFTQKVLIQKDSSEVNLDA